MNDSIDDIKKRLELLTRKADENMIEMKKLINQLDDISFKINRLIDNNNALRNDIIPLINKVVDNQEKLFVGRQKLYLMPIDDISDDRQMVIINGHEVFPDAKNNSIYYIVGGKSYRFNGHYLYEVYRIDDISYDRKRIIDGDYKVPEKDIIYVDPYGNEYTYNGYLLLG